MSVKDNAREHDEETSPTVADTDSISAQIMALLDEEDVPDAVYPPPTEPVPQSWRAQQRAAEAEAPVVGVPTQRADVTRESRSALSLLGTEETYLNPQAFLQAQGFGEADVPENPTWNDVLAFLSRDDAADASQRDAEHRRELRELLEISLAPESLETGADTGHPAIFAAYGPPDPVAFGRAVGEMLAAVVRATRDAVYPPEPFEPPEPAFAPAVAEELGTHILDYVWHDLEEYFEWCYDDENWYGFGGTTMTPPAPDRPYMERMLATLERLHVELIYQIEDSMVDDLFEHVFSTSRTLEPLRCAEDMRRFLELQGQDVRPFMPRHANPITHYLNEIMRHLELSHEHDMEWTPENLEAAGGNALTRFSEAGIQFVQNVLQKFVEETPEDQGGEYLAELLVNVDEVHEVVVDSRARFKWHLRRLGIAATEAEQDAASDSK